MYRDTEETYRGWTLDVFQPLPGNVAGTPANWWVCNWHYSGGYYPQSGTIRGRRKKEVTAEAHRIIDGILERGEHI